MSASPHYVPGRCNIGGREVTRRKVIGWTGLVATVAMAATLAYVDGPRVWRLLVVLPLMAGATGLLQAYTGFCSTFGLLGLSNVHPEQGRPQRVAHGAARRSDRARAVAMFGNAAAIAALAALVFYWVP